MRTNSLKTFAGIATVLALAVASNGAFAQSANQSSDITPPDKYGPPINGGNPPQAQPTPGDNSGSLSNHLSGSGGVVTPPPTGDKGGVIPPPDAGPNATPVIPPNGNGNTEPK